MFSVRYGLLMLSSGRATNASSSLRNERPACFLQETVGLLPPLIEVHLFSYIKQLSVYLYLTTLLILCNLRHYSLAV